MCVYKIHHNILLLYLAKVEYGRTLIMLKKQSTLKKDQLLSTLNVCVINKLKPLFHTVTNLKHK